MPDMPPKPCGKPGCPNLATGHPRCVLHRAAYDEQRKRDMHERMAKHEGTRLNSRQRGYTKRWEKYRANYLGGHPLCMKCMATDEVTAATVVDHIIPHGGDEVLFWDENNHQALCKPCHDRKTWTEDRQPKRRG